MGYAKKRQKMVTTQGEDADALWEFPSPFRSLEMPSTVNEHSQSNPQWNLPTRLQQQPDSHGIPPLRLDIPPPHSTPTPVLHQAHKRQLADSISSAVGALETQIVSILDVIVDNGSSVIAALTLTAVPSQGTVISVPSVGDITIPAATTTPSGPSPPSSTAPPMTISVPGPSSQVVLSSPPSTPVPSSASSAAPSDSSSYFSSSTTPATGSGQVTSTVTPPSSTSSLASNNSTISTFTSTFSQTTITGTTILPLTTLASNSTRLSTTFSHTTSSSSGASLTGSSSRTSTQSSAFTSALTFVTSTASTGASTSGSAVASSTGEGIGGGIGGGGTATSTAPSTSSSAAGGSTNQSSMPPTPVLVGGVVGGVAGLTIVLLLLLVFFRWRRKKKQNRQLGMPDTEAAEGTARGAPPTSQRFLPLPTPFKRSRPAPAELPLTERGFQNLGGRKIESVLTSGGDGFGNPGTSNQAPSAQAARNVNLAGTSFLRDSRASEPTSEYTAPSSPATSPGLQELAGSRVPGERISDTPEIVTMRPGPARTPVTSQGPFSPPPPRGTPPPQSLPPSRFNPPRDGIGRSHPGQDGSRGSRFAEDVT